MGRTSRASFSQVSQSAKTEFEKARKEIDRLSKDIQRLDRESAAAGKRGNTELAASFKAQADAQRGEMEKASQVAIAAQGRIASEAVKTGAVTRTALTSGVSGAGAAAAREGGAISRVFGNLRTQAQQTGTAIKTGLTSGAFEGVGKKATLAGAGILAAFAGLEKVTIGFDKTISRVGAVSDATADQLGHLRQAALDAGAATVFSASDAAEAEVQLAKAGLSVGQVIGGLRGTLALAASDNLELGEAATIAATAMTQFKLPATDIGHIADVLAAGANKSTASVSSLAQGLGEAGGVAKQAHFSFEDTVATLALFDQNALKGAEGGTALKTMLLRLIAPVDKAAGAMEDLGIQVYDAAGSVRPANQLFAELQNRLGPLSEEVRNNALVTIFGTRAIRGATIALQEGGKGWQKWRDAVRGNGEATKFASANMDNLAGDIERLKGAIEVGLIGAGSGATPVLRELATAGESAANVFTGLPGPVQGVAGAAIGLSGAALAAGGAVAVLVPSIHKMRDGLTQLGPAGIRANQSLGFLGRLGGYAAGVGAVAVGIDLLSTQLATMTGKDLSVSKLTDGLLLLGAALDDAEPGFEAMDELARGFGVSLDGLTDDVKRYAHANDDLAHGANPFQAIRLSAERLSPAFTNNVKDIDALDKSLAGMFRTGGKQAEVATQVWAMFRAEFKGAGVDQGLVNKAFNDTTDALAEQATQEKTNAAAARDHAVSLGLVNTQLEDTSQDADKAAEAVDMLKDAFDALIGVNVGAINTDIQFRQELAELQKALLEGGRTLDLNSEAGQKNAIAINAAVTAAGDHAQAVAEQARASGNASGATTLYNQVLNNHREALIKVMVQMGYTRDAATRYIDELGLTPRDVTTTAVLNTATAEADLARLKASYDAFNRSAFAPRPPGVVGPTLAGTPGVSQNTGQDRNRSTFRPRARGGPVDKGTPYLTGEQGVEAFVPAIRKRTRSPVAKLAQSAEDQAREQLVALGIARPRQAPAERTVPLTASSAPPPGGPIPIDRLRGLDPKLAMKLYPGYEYGGDDYKGPKIPNWNPADPQHQRMALWYGIDNFRQHGGQVFANAVKFLGGMQVAGKAEKVSPLVAGAVQGAQKVENMRRGGVVKGRPRLGVAAMLLGQHGPQLFVPPSDGVVVKASDTRRLLRAREPKEVEGILSRAGADRRTLSAVGVGAPRRAGGGTARRGQPYVTGERGVEAYVAAPLKREPGGVSIQVGNTNVKVQATTQRDRVQGVSEAEVNKIVARHQRAMIAELAQVVEKGQR